MNDEDDTPMNCENDKDILHRMRVRAMTVSGFCCHDDLIDDAADKNERLREENQRLKDTLKACLKEGVKTQFLDGEIYIRDAGCGCCSEEPLNLTPEQVKLVKDLTLEEIDGVIKPRSNQ